MSDKKTPEIRFDGFTDTWEQREFNDLLNTNISTNSLSRDMLTDENTNIKNIHYGDILVKYREMVSVKSDKIPHIIDDDKNKYSGSFLQNGDVIFADAAEDETAGKVSEIADISDELVVAGLHTIVARPIEKVASQYLGYYLNSNAYHNQLLPLMQGTKVMSISKSALSKTSLNIAKEIEEQTKIGEIFKNLDNLITCHQRKYDQLQTVKKSMLEKMFPQNGAKVPEIRFDGFTDDWEQRELGEVAERVVRKNSNLESSLPLTISAQYGLVDQIRYFNNRVASKDVSNYYLMHKGEFAYNKSYSEGYPFGAIKCLKNYDMGVLSTLYIIFSANQNIVKNKYLESFYDTDNWHKEIAERAAEGARNHGLLNITADDFFKTKLSYPGSIKEQTLIGEYFSTLDNLITTRQSELDKLKNIKKSMLEKMFV